MGKDREKRILTVLLLLFFAGTTVFYGQEYDRETVLEKARLAVQKAEYQKAIDLCQSYLAGKEADVEVSFVLAQAQAFSGDYEAALKTLDLILQRQPDHGDARELKASVERWKRERDKEKDREKETTRTAAAKFEIWAQYRSDDYSSEANSFGSQRIFLVWRPSSRLTIIPRVAHTRYFNQTDYQFGLEAYPKLWKKAYALVDLSYATPAHSLPRTSWWLEIYQGFYRGLEASLGYWKMNFPASDVSIALGSLGYYFKDYYFLARGYYSSVENGHEFSWLAQGRRYFGSENYVYLLFGSGSRPFEISNVGDLVFIKSIMFGGGFNFYVKRHWKVEGVFSRVKEKDGPRRTTISLTTGYRF